MLVGGMIAAVSTGDEVGEEFVIHGGIPPLCSCIGRTEKIHAGTASERISIVKRAIK